VPKVIVYSTSWCPWCTRTKEFLKENKIAFKDINVEKDQKATKEMMDKSGQMGVPVIDIDGTIIVGFNESEIRKALKI
jgi:glutaredoxin-like YruB-family protein